MSDLKQPGQRAYEAWYRAKGYYSGLYEDSLNKHAWAAVEQELLPAEPEQASVVYRCKRIKPGDGGIVDGCGWQGPAPTDDRCPSCGSVTLRTVPAEPEQAGKAQGWIPVEERPLEPGETRVMAVEILRNGTPDWDVFVATVSDEYENEWTSESNDPGWEPSEVGYSMSIEGLPALPTKDPTNG